MSPVKDVLQGCCWTRVCSVSLRAWMHGAKASRDDVTIAPSGGVTKWRYRVNFVSNLPKCPVPGRCYTALTEVSGTDTGTGSGTDVHIGTGVTGVDAVPNVP